MPSKDIPIWYSDEEVYEKLKEEKDEQGKTWLEVLQDGLDIDRQY